MNELKPCPECENWASTAYQRGGNLLMFNFCPICGRPFNDTGHAILANRRTAPENKPLTLEQLRQMDGDWVWLIDTRHSEYNGWYNVRPFHDGSGIELYGVDNNYYERAITTDRVKAYARKSEVST